MTSVNLDEYKGLPGTNEQSYYYFMHQHLFDQVNIQERHTHLPNGMEPDSKKECERYEELIRSLGGVDLQLLGMGHNGHIGFNEPGQAFETGTHCVDLQESTIEAKKDFLLWRRMFQDRHIPWGKDNYAGKEDSCCSKWGRQSRDCKESIFRTSNSRCAGINPSDA